MDRSLELWGEVWSYGKAGGNAKVAKVLAFVSFELLA